MRRSFTVAIGLLLMALPATAKPRLHLQQLGADALAKEGTVRLLASLVELEGRVDGHRAASEFALRIDGKDVGVPEQVRPFSDASIPLELVLVVESSALFGPKEPPLPPPPLPPARRRHHRRAPSPSPAPPPAGPAPLDQVKEAVQALLHRLGPRTRVLLIDYGGEATPHPPFRAPAAVANEVDELTPDGEAGDLSLVPAIEQGLRALAQTRPQAPFTRQLILVISDGLNRQMDRQTFRALGDAAAAAQVPIASLAFSPSDERGPLLNLGELSKRSHGSFRWARTAADLGRQLATFADELAQQYVLTFRLERAPLAHQRLQLVVGRLTSNSLDYHPPPGASTRPFVPWWAVALGGVVLFGGAAALLVARRPRRPMRFSPYRDVGPQPPVGDALAPARVAAAARTTPPSQSRGHLLVVSGARAGQRCELEALPLTIGKGAAALALDDDPTVSSRHAALDRRGSVFVVTDLGSTNGTYVNGRRIAEPTPLGDGDLVRVGNTQLKFRSA